MPKELDDKDRLPAAEDEEEVDDDDEEAFRLSDPDGSGDDDDDDDDDQQQDVEINTEPIRYWAAQYTGESTVSLGRVYWLTSPARMEPISKRHG